jgi:hypothetical protein
MKNKNSIWFTAPIVVSMALGGCATYNMTNPAPHEARPVAVNFVDDDLSGWTDLPIGTYRVPDSQVIISGHQKGNGAAMMFGLVGVAVANSMQKSAGKSAVKSSEEVLHLKITPEARTDLADFLKSDDFSSRFATAATPDAASVTISGGIVLTFVDEGSVLPFVVLRATLSDAKPSTKTWTTRYICSQGMPKPLTGDASWTADGGDSLRATVSAEVKEALHVLLSDVSVPAPRDEAHRVAVSGYYPFIQGRFQLMGYSLQDDGRYLAFTPKIGDVNVIAGVNIVDKSAVTYRDAVKEDKPFTRLENTKTPSSVTASTPAVQ